MKCPYCEKEMETGFLGTGGNNLIWDTKTHSLIWTPSKQGFTLAYRPTGAYVEAFHCKDCKTILCQYEEQK